MLKLIWGTVGSGKTLRLLENYQNLKRWNPEGVKLLKPKEDTRTVGVYTRFSNLEIPADFIIDNEDKETFISFVSNPNYKCIIIDEIQFVNPDFADILFSEAKNKSIFCYGLRNDFKLNMWPIITKLINLADSVEEKESLCAKCHINKASFNVSLNPNGPEKGFHYLGVCSQCYTG